MGVRREWTPQELLSQPGRGRSHISLVFGVSCSDCCASWGSQVLVIQRIKIWKMGLKVVSTCGNFYGCNCLFTIPGQEVCWMLTPKDQLLASHEEFRRLAQEHLQYAQRLDSLTQKRYLTEDEKMEHIERQYRQHGQHQVA